MAQLITMALGDSGDGEAGGTAVFEVDDEMVEPGLEGVRPVVGRMSVQQALEQLAPVLSMVSRSVLQLRPDEMEIEFGLKMGGETGIVIAKGTGGVNFAVRLAWKGR